MVKVFFSVCEKIYDLHQSPPVCCRLVIALENEDTFGKWLGDSNASVGHLFASPLKLATQDDPTVQNRAERLYLLGNESHCSECTEKIVNEIWKYYFYITPLFSTVFSKQYHCNQRPSDDTTTSRGVGISLASNPVIRLLATHWLLAGGCQPVATVWDGKIPPRLWRPSGWHCTWVQSCLAVVMSLDYKFYTNNSVTIFCDSL